MNLQISIIIPIPIHPKPNTNLPKLQNTWMISNKESCRTNTNFMMHHEILSPNLTYFLWTKKVII